jgi:signal transduction histidine kinase
LVGLLTVAAFGALSLRESSANSDAARWVDRAREVISANDLAILHVTEAESARRGYVITREAAHRQRFDVALANTRRQLRVLARLTNESPAQRARVSRLRALVEQRLAALEASVRTIGRGSFDVDVERERTQSSIAEMRQLLALSEALSRGEYAELRARRAAARTAQQSHRTISLVGTAVALTFLASVFVWLDLENSARVQIENALRDEIATRVAVAGDLSKANAVLRQSLSELAKANALAVSANAEVEAFSYTVSHDLRTPLRAIDGFAHALAEEYDSVLDATGRDFLARIRRASGRMAQLIDDMLDLSQLTRSTLACEPVDLSQLAATVLSELASREPSREVETRVESGMTIHGDARLIRIVLENVLGNAWKFTAKTERARIDVLSEGHGADRAYFIRDNGAGFDPSMADKLFGAFQRLHKATEFSGTGVGLATVRRVMMLHGGHIRAEGATNQGASFRLWFPTPELMDTIPMDSQTEGLS